jgi:hypothetical protein
MEIIKTTCIEPASPGILPGIMPIQFNLLLPGYRLIRIDIRATSDLLSGQIDGEVPRAAHSSSQGIGRNENLTCCTLYYISIKVSYLSIKVNLSPS